MKLLWLLFLLAIQSSESCDSEAKVEFDTEYNDCLVLAQVQSPSDRCELIEIRLNCLRSTEAKYNCLTEAQEVRLEGNFMIAEYRKAGNQSDSCPILSEWISDYVAKYYGNTDCSFDLILENIRLKNVCEAKVQAQKQMKKQSIISNEDWLKYFCFAKKETENCQPLSQECMDTAKKELIQIENEKYWNSAKAQINAMEMFATFSYENCPE